MTSCTHPTSSLFIANALVCLLLWLLLPFKATGQQVIIRYLGEDKSARGYAQDGRFMDFPEATYMATLKATSKASVWTYDSLLYKREGLLGEGYNAAIPGQWDYRNKIAGKLLSHRTNFGAHEYVETNIEKPPYNTYTDCQEWRLESNPSKTILGMPCIKATRSCGTREHVVYFTRSIPIIDGPIYVSALPGLILEFNDGKFHWLAQHITANEEEVPAPLEVRLIDKDQYGPSDIRLVISKKRNTLVINEWIDLTRHYLVR